MAVPIGSFPGGVIFGGFTCHVASFRVAGVALRDVWTCLVTCRKSFCVAGAILLRRFQNMRCIFRGRRSILDVSSVISRGRRSTSDVSCITLSEIALARLCECKLRGKRGILRHVLKFGGKPRSIYGGSCKTCASEGVTERVWLRSIYGGSYKTLTFRSCQSVKIGGSLVRNARFDAATCLLLCLCGFPMASFSLLWKTFQQSELKH